MTIADILDKIRELSTSSADMGRQFEKLVKYFLYNSPLYSSQIKEVWLWNDFPYRGSATDSGIDLVAKTETGEYWAIQCKFYQEGSQISKPDIDSFISAASTLKDESGKKKYSKRLVVATVEPTSTARDTMNQQDIPSTFLHINEFDNAGVDWDKFWEQFTAGGDVSNVQQEKFSLREHQQRAFDDVIKGFQTADRGKLIMACGTGKTFTSLKIAEEMASPGGLVLYAVPSLALLGQTLSEWSIHSQRILRPILVCSDTSINEQDKRKKKATEDESEIQPSDLALPATTSAKDIVEQYQKFAQKSDNGYIVVFSTYQSLDAVKKAQKKGLPEFDLIVCDEAHRTTGISIDDGGEEESYFLLPHDNKNIKAKKRLYMTATPRIYGTRAKEKAKNEGCDVICSMDDENIYGKDFHELSFGEAVKQDLLTDYKVIIITVSERKYAEFLQFEKFDPEDYKKQFPRLKRANDEDVKELMISDLAKMFGCWQGLAKRSHYLGADGKLTNDFASDPAPMRTAVAFASTIKVSKNIVAPWFKDLSNNIEQWQTRQRESNPNFDEPTLHLQVRHVDGTIVANARAEEIKWLKTGILPKHSEDADQSNGADQPPAAPDPNACRILTNVRCLSEGVDVPALDAVIFLSPRNSKVDIVQSVGRVMRKAPGKKYGYVILPIAISDDDDPEKVLDNTDRFKVVWDVLQTLRSHDDRLRIEINKLRFKDDDPPAPGPFGGNGGPGDDDGDTQTLPLSQSDSPIIIAGGFSQLNENIRARVVKRCGDRDYLEESAKEIALIAQQHVEQIKKQLQNPTPQQKKAFDEFLEKLQQDLNPSIDQAEAIEMISQHIIMQPVFDALFADYSFAKKNVVSQAFENLLDVFKEESSQEEWAKLEKVRKSIRDRVEGITSWRHKQTVITSLYDKFFKIAAEKTAERLGIVYTPVEVVDFIIHSVEHILQTEFKKSMNNRNVHILDPFTGTGTFIVQLLQSGIIKPDGANFAYKFNNELHANEIVLLAYYIASINIESTFHAVGKRKKYSPFPGLALTDTFQMGEKDMPENAEVNSTIEDAELENVENDERILRQRRSTIEVILGNPPYSAGQGSSNDNNQNQDYPKLDKRVEETYAAESTANLKNSLYDSYIKAFRWASDRIGNKGVIGFVTNGGWLDGNAQDGLRKCFAKEFTSIYVFNLRGNARTSGEQRQKEAGNVFGAGTRTPVIITILVKNPEKVGMNCQIFYYDIGDYLKREEKLQIIKEFHDISNPKMDFQLIMPNQHGDWINQRGEDFPNYFALGDKKGEETTFPTFFESHYSNGLKTNRDTWAYNFSEKELTQNMKRMISFYNQQVLGFGKYLKNHPDATVEEFMDTDPTKISWSSGLIYNLQKLNLADYQHKENRIVLYRPFCKINLYWGDKMIERRGLFPSFFPTVNTQNLIICISGIGITKDFSVICSNAITDVQLQANCQCFPLYYYTKEGEEDSSLFGSEGCEVVDGYVRHDGVTDAILARAKEQYNVKSITKKDLFYYVYGFLHSPVYRQKYAADLKKSLARIPLVKSYDHFLAFADAGEKLALLHLNYDEPGKLKNAIKQINKNVTNKFESVPVKRTVQNPNGADDADLYRVEKMRFPKKNGEDDKSRIAYNERITLENIPLEAYEYVVNGKSAIEWIMDRYQVKTDPASQIVNDPNLWNDGKTPQYIVELLESVVTVSVNTMRIVNSLPKEWEA